MTQAIYNYFQKKSGRNAITSTSSIDDLDAQDAVPIIQKNWSFLMKNQVDVGHKIYDYILTKEINMSRLFMQTNIQQQTGLFMDMMNKVVGFLDDVSTMDHKIQQIGKKHVVQYGIKTKHFKYFKAAFMKAIKRYLPWNDRRENSWNWFWEKIITNMSQPVQINRIPLLSRFRGKELTANDIIAHAHNVHLTFDTALHSDPKGFAKKFYASLISKDPAIKKLFSDTTFEEQASRFISMLCHSIKLLDETDTFTQKLQLLAKQHVDYGVQIFQLQAFGDILISNVKELNQEKYQQQLKLIQSKIKADDNDNNDNDNDIDMKDVDILNVPEWTDAHQESWEWFWKLVVSIFSDGMNEQININKINLLKTKAVDKQKLQDMDFSIVNVADVDNDNDNINKPNDNDNDNDITMNNTDNNDNNNNNDNDNNDNNDNNK